MYAEFVFVRDDASKPPLSFLYRGPYRVLRPSEKVFFIQIRDKSDSVSVDGLKPVISSVSVVPGVPPVRSRLASPKTSLNPRTSSSRSSSSEKSYFFSGEESEVFSGSSYAALPESSPVS